MTVIECYDEAAVRHFEDAESLAGRGRFDGAGHLIGLAAECAIKHAIDSVRPEAGALHVHLPALVEAAKKRLQGTRRRGMLGVFQLAQYFAGWVVDRRYERNRGVSSELYGAWKDHAQRTLAAAGLRRAAHG